MTSLFKTITSFEEMTYTECPHLDSPCTSRVLQLRALCPGTPPEELNRLFRDYQKHVERNPVFPLLALENPTVWGERVVQWQFELLIRSVTEKIINEGTITQQRKMLWLLLEKLWWIRATGVEAPLVMLDLMKKHLFENHEWTKKFDEAKRKLMDTVKASPKIMPAGMISRALFYGCVQGKHIGESFALCFRALYAKKQDMEEVKRTMRWLLQEFTTVTNQPMPSLAELEK